MGGLTSVMKMTVLIWADLLSFYAMWMMMAYLTDVWKISFTHAAAIVNVFWGLVHIMPSILQFIVDTVMGSFWMVLLTSLAYCAGLGFLTMSTPPVLSDATGTCSAYKPECIGEGQKVLFYTALALIVMGMAGHLTSLASLMTEHMTLTYQTGEVDATQFWSFFFGVFGVVIVPIATVIAIPYIKPWSLRFGIPAICTVVATIIFLTGSRSYKYAKPQGSPLTTVFRVFIAFASKLFHKLPRDTNQLYERHESQFYSVPYTRRLRCLDKAAIIVESQSLEQQEKNRWRLCRVSEVEETKSLICMIPICSSFLMLGLVSSIGNTYFVEQANHMNKKVGKLKVPLPILLWFYDQAKSQLAVYYFQIAGLCFGNSRSRRYAAPIGIAVSMIFAILCSITAAKVEGRRLDVVNSHGLLDKPEETVPMTMFWLLPQFLLLGGLDGISENSIASFLVDQVPQTLGPYMGLFASGVSGVGILGSVLSVYIVGKVSSKGDKPNWFQYTLNRSRLDKYYWVLALLSAANLVFFILMALWYAYRDSRSEDMEAPEYDETNEPFEDNAQCCC
ncbi:protein NRT1/ PTR FAMILY 5.5-like [Humulus lupulus]|uniref:protein NRT1/ PTR FAMILY 5.5-like n=1 Tax=Humulus lupulus TaxID=3486 RepID=UPI002B402163|nr:protein NRT1/ PTR FAMILY 5.5-like [Humulus lupulus]